MLQRLQPFADKVTETPGEILNTPFVFLSELAPCNLRRCTYWYAVERIVIVVTFGWAAYSRRINRHLYPRTC